MRLTTQVLKGGKGEERKVGNGDEREARRKKDIILKDIIPY